MDEVLIIRSLGFISDTRSPQLGPLGFESNTLSPQVRSLGAAIENADPAWMIYQLNYK
jgi:hypothetical protein